MPAYAILLIVVAIFVIFSLVAGIIFSGLILFSRQQPIVKTPQEYGMAYDDVRFKSIDGLTLSGWFIPAEANDAAGKQSKVVIITHPFPFNRHGFLAKNQGFPPLAWTDVDLLTTAQALHQAGYAVLMFDFRNHGKSDRAITGVGLEEYKDVLGAIEYIRQLPPLNEPQIGFVSFCMGANATIVALSKGEELVEDIKFLVAVQPISASVFVRSYMKKVYTPLSLFLIPIVDKLVQWRGGYALDAMSPLDYVKDLKVPTLYIQAREDPWTELSDIEGFYQATQAPKEFWWLEGKMKRFEAYNYVGKHPDRMLEFINKW
ncbi:MAG: alpha/beta hydrolase [Anaerolineae bacterium]|nr:alpha/beta hydrolase [Anaerolineae bacterium]